MTTLANRYSLGLRGLAVILILLLTGCGNSSSGTAQPGTLTVSLTDTPACGYDEVNVTVSKVRVHQSGSVGPNGAGWSDITLVPPRKINLLTLNDPTQPNLALETLGQTPLPPGHYTQLRLVVEVNHGSSPPFANSVVLSGTTTEIPLDTPSGLQSGIKLNHQFNVPSGEQVDLLLDFDACRSIVRHTDGTYALKPVIRVIPFVVNGIEGFVDPSILGQNVLVTAQVNGEIVRATVPNSNLGTPTLLGKFFLARLDAPATYDVVITADNHATIVIANVPVQTSTSVTPISSEALPIVLSASATQTVNGTVALNPPDDEGVVTVTANQTLNPGPTVTVKAQSAMLVSGNPVGDYQYNLVQVPTAAPSLGHYSPTQPIPLSSAAQGAVAGMYTIQGRAETTSTTYGMQIPVPSSASVTGGLTQDFTLTP